MALPVHKQALWWGIAAAMFLAALWLLGDVILPFLVGGAIAYLLDPLADRLERLGLSRVIATILISIGFVAVFIFAVLLVVPLVVQQGVALFEAAPDLFAQLQAFVAERFPQVLEEGNPVRESLSGIGETLRAQGGALAERLFTSALGVVNAVVFVIVVPVVAFYLLLDWDRMIETVDRWLPRDHRATIRRLAGEVDGVLAGFVRGQLSVCTILGAFYALSLMLVGLQYGVVIGVVAGLISFIPYVGTIVGGVLAIGLALFQFWESPLWIGIVIAIFVSGQMVEGNFLTPKLVGGSVGLHPVWLLFALSAFGTLFGFAGMLVAVPVAAAIGVFARFALSKYAEGRLYRGLDDNGGDQGRGT